MISLPLRFVIIMLMAIAVYATTEAGARSSSSRSGPRHHREICSGKRKDLHGRRQPQLPEAGEPDFTGLVQILPGFWSKYASAAGGAAAAQISEAFNANGLAFTPEQGDTSGGKCPSFMKFESVTIPTPSAAAMPSLSFYTSSNGTILQISGTLTTSVQTGSMSGYSNRQILFFCEHTNYGNGNIVNGISSPFSSWLAFDLSGNGSTVRAMAPSEVSASPAYPAPNWGPYAPACNSWCTTETQSLMNQILNQVGTYATIQDAVNGVLRAVAKPTTVAPNANNIGLSLLTNGLTAPPPVTLAMLTPALTAIGLSAPDLLVVGSLGVSPTNGPSVLPSIGDAECIMEVASVCTDRSFFVGGMDVTVSFVQCAVCVAVGSDGQSYEAWAVSTSM